MSADLLRRASALIRETAEAAEPGPYKVVDVPPYGLAVGMPNGDAHGAFDPCTAFHIILWSPDVATLVAGWLDDTAEDVENGLSPELDPGYINPNAWPVRLARRILGED